MNIPGFTAETALQRSRTSYAKTVSRIASTNLVVPQDCGVLKGFGCGIGPISWCFLAGFGGPGSFCDCVDRMSGGDCLECTNCAGSGRGLDPRGHEGDPSTGTVGSGRFGLTGGVTVGPPPGRRYPDLSDLKRQLDRIERCTCGLPSLVLNVPLSGSGLGAVYVPPVAVSPPLILLS